ncbi:hypothetical protein [Streptomyces sp. NPDC002403]
MTTLVTAEIGPFKLTGGSGEKLDADLTLSVEIEPGKIKTFPAGENTTRNFESEDIKFTALHF